MINIISFIITIIITRHIASMWIFSFVAIPFSRWQVQRCCSVCYVKVSALASVCKFGVWHCRSVAVEWNASVDFMTILELRWVRKINLCVHHGVRSREKNEINPFSKFYWKVHHVVTSLLSQKLHEIRLMIEEGKQLQFLNTFPHFHWKMQIFV